MDPKDTESEAHGPEKEALSKNAEAAKKVKAAKKADPAEKAEAANGRKGKFLCIDGTNDNKMMTPLYFGALKVIFLHVLHPNICLQAEENSQTTKGRKSMSARSRRERPRKPKEPI